MGGFAADSQEPGSYQPECSPAQDNQPRRACVMCALLMNSTCYACTTVVVVIVFRTSVSKFSASTSLKPLNFLCARIL